MRPAICRSSDHLFLPVLEVHTPLLRCIHCDVFAYQDTVKDLAKKRGSARAGQRVPAVRRESILDLAGRWFQKVWGRIVSRGSAPP